MNLSLKLTLNIGIPFAESPTGSLRFAPPVPKHQLGVSEFNATQSGASCAQFVRQRPDFVTLYFRLDTDVEPWNMHRLGLSL